jgi:hypothetical protein
MSPFAPAAQSNPNGERNVKQKQEFELDNRVTGIKFPIVCFGTNECASRIPAYLQYSRICTAVYIVGKQLHFDRI